MFKKSTIEKSPKKSKFKILSILFDHKEECEIFIRKDAPMACGTVLADFSTVCGCGCCGVSVA